MVAHEPVRVFCSRLDITVCGMGSGIMQQAYRRFLLRQAVTETSRVLVVPVCWKNVRSQGNAELSIGGIMDGRYRKLEIRINLNIHCKRCLCVFIIKNERVKIHYFHVIQKKLVILQQR